jgi:hypothetical protein
LVSAAVIINFTGKTRDTELETAAQRLDALFDYVREQAELQTRDYGFRVNDRVIPSWRTTCSAISGAPSMRTMPCASGNSPRASCRPWWSKARHRAQAQERRQGT